MTKRTMTATTPHGTFSRGTATPYTHVVVRTPDCDWREIHSPAELVAKWKGIGTGVFARYVKDGGYVVSWHGSEAAARKAAEGKGPGYITARPLGVYPVDAK